MATHSSVLAWRIPGTGKSGGLPSMTMKQKAKARTHHTHTSSNQLDTSEKKMQTSAALSFHVTDLEEDLDTARKDLLKSKETFQLPEL